MKRFISTVQAIAGAAYFFLAGWARFDSPAGPAALIVAGVLLTLSALSTAREAR